MKRISLILVAFLFVSLISCDKETQIDQVDTESVSKVNEFLNSYYSEAYSNGKSMNLDNNTMKVTEIIGLNQKTPIGYVVTSTGNSELLYFVDINIADNSLISIDFKQKAKETFFKEIFSLDDFIENQNIKDIDNFSFLDIIKNVDNTASKRRFWGWSCGDDYYVGGSCLHNCTHYVFWMENGSCNACPCN